MTPKEQEVLTQKGASPRLEAVNQHGFSVHDRSCGRGFTSTTTFTSHSYVPHPTTSGFEPKRLGCVSHMLGLVQKACVVHPAKQLQLPFIAYCGLSALLLEVHKGGQNMGQLVSSTDDFLWSAACQPNSESLPQSA